MRAVIIATAVAFLVSLFGTPLAIKGFTRLKLGQPIRIDGPQTHLVKQGTPTMGGVVVIVATVIAYVAGHLALTGLPTAQIAQVGPTMTGLVLLGVYVFSGAIGFIDDFLKVRERNSAGLSERGKLVGQLLVGVAFGIVALAYESTNGQTVASTSLSFVRDIDWLDLSRYGAVAVFVVLVLATTNAVNLTDGLDGLAAGVSVMVLVAYGLIAFWQYRHWCADIAPGGYNASGLQYCYQVRDPLEVAMLAAAVAGALVGFLWWNASPAKIIMGDTGAMAIGGLIAAMAVATRTVLLLPIIGGLFVIITMSLVIQRISYKTTGRRVFLNSPLHHHFEMKGWSEVNVAIRFWIIGGTCAVIGLGIFYGNFLVATS
ncbi:phospho-N-acetylmuramoyl-pentapeptide-transferase [Plantactinospora sp. KBS50]|uniref:phospho-N-acetylmuramoyl-pentapeptide- transferase n=1 Tax=Plantactinospora sp. KBS50 TaxID=2024580 RepID=UPI000BAAEF08|nr:phospho-N-acetylmuramoyl-pentapeptide-transferase [Plantactinospora sp. KBS50]ASW54437.1 phospho-N-acetylmuramoyl-pentapeptide-transferase [Plantactinospora sp. KBS50]